MLSRLGACNPPPEPRCPKGAGHLLQCPQVRAEGPTWLSSVIIMISHTHMHVATANTMQCHAWHARSWAPAQQALMQTCCPYMALGMPKCACHKLDAAWSRVKHSWPCKGHCAMQDLAMSLARYCFKSWVYAQHEYCKLSSQAQKCCSRACYAAERQLALHLEGRYKKMRCSFSIAFTQLHPAAYVSCKAFTWLNVSS